MILSADDVKRDGRRKPRASGDDPEAGELRAKSEL